MAQAPALAPLASFEAKWIATRPEFSLGLRFVAARDRPAQTAFACLVLELEHAAFGIRETQPAAVKLQWWAEELARAGNGNARHPLTRALAAHAAFGMVPLAHWVAVIGGALAQRDAQPAADRAALLDGYGALYRPLAGIEACLFARLDSLAIAHVGALARALRETASLADTLRDGRLPLPLDLLARHRLARGDLARRSPAQGAALRDWLGALASDYPDVARARLGALHAAGASADRWRARQASGDDEPLPALAPLFARLPLRSAWLAWQAGRRSSN